MARPHGTREVPPVQRVSLTRRPFQAAQQPMPQPMRRAQQRLAAAQHPGAPRVEQPRGETLPSQSLLGRTDFLREQNALMREQNDILSVIAERLLVLITPTDAPVPPEPEPDVPSEPEPAAAAPQETEG